MAEKTVGIDVLKTVIPCVISEARKKVQTAVHDSRVHAGLTRQMW